MQLASKWQKYNDKWVFVSLLHRFSPHNHVTIATKTSHCLVLSHSQSTSNVSFLPCMRYQCLELLLFTQVTMAFTVIFFNIIIPLHVQISIL